MRLWYLVETSNGALLPVGPPLGDPLVTGVVTTDLADPGRYLAGGELVLSGLAWWRPRRPDRSQSFVAALVGAKVAALAAGDAELGRVPHDLVLACAEAGLPLLRVPVTVPFAAIHEHVNRHLSARRSDDLAAVIGRHRELMAAASSGSGIAGVLDLVAGDLGLHCRVLSPTGRLVAGTAGPPGEDRRLAQHYLRATRLPHLVRRPGGRVVTLVGAGAPRAAAWFLAVGEDHAGWTPERREVVAELASLVALEYGLGTRRPDAEDRLAATLAGPEPAPEVLAAVRRCGLDPDGSLVALVATGPVAAAVLAEALADRGDWRLGTVNSLVIAVVAGADPAELLAHLRATLDHLAPALTDELRIGVSDQVHGAAGLIGAVAAARAVAATVPAIGVAGPDRLSSHELLLAAVPAQLREAYRDRVLGPLLDHDRVHRTELVRTLAAYLDCSGSWSRCAAMMHVHVNTLRYRMERIETLTGRNLRTLADQTDLLLALRLNS